MEGVFRKWKSIETYLTIGLFYALIHTYKNGGFGDNLLSKCVVAAQKSLGDTDLG